MREIIDRLILLTALFLFANCVGHLETVQISVSIGTEDNPLRIPLSIRFNRECSYWVEYWKDGGEVVRTSTAQSNGRSGSATLMFLYPEMSYHFRVCATLDGKVFKSEESMFTTGSIPFGVPRYPVDIDNSKRELPGLILQSSASTPGFVTFCDFDGQVVWYQRFDQPVRQVSFNPSTGTLLLNLGFRFSSTGDLQRVAEKTVMIDLKGNVLLERIAGDGYLDYPHHEIIQMPDGNILALHNTTRRFDLSSMGGEVDTEIFGEGFTIFDESGASVWSWDCFSCLDPLRDISVKPIINAMDLMHANSVCWDVNGDYYISFNKLNEFWKIGKKGNMLYRAKCNTEGIHSLVALSPDRILLLDNGRTTGFSRAVIVGADPESGDVTEEFSVSFPHEYCSINRSNVDYHPDIDLMMFCSTVRCALVFTDLEGNILKVLKREDISYRAYYYDSIEY